MIAHSIGLHIAIANNGLEHVIEGSHLPSSPLFCLYFQLYVPRFITKFCWLKGSKQQILQIQ
jgi:hypothetical protein